MKKTKYLIKRIMNMNFTNFFQTIGELSIKTKKTKIFLFFDVIYCGIRYQAGYIDYQLFEMHNLNSKQRKTVLTRGINNSIVKKFNDPKFNSFFNNKAKFNSKFNEYLNRDWLLLNNNEYEFKEFVKKHKDIFCKPLDLSCGKGIEKISTKNMDINKLYKYLVDKKLLLIEEVAKQHKSLNDLHPSSINTIRVVTINNGKTVSVVAAFLRMGNNNNYVDNFNNEGLTTKINIKDGTINVVAIDKKQNIYEKHPITGKKILGFKIPMWEETKNLCIEASKIIPEIGYVAWDICIGINKPTLIEGNEFPGHDLYQLPPHRENNVGVLPEFKKAIERGLNN